jgi:hypothetical protein
MGSGRGTPEDGAIEWSLQVASKQRVRRELIGVFGSDLSDGEVVIFACGTE